jgi:uncharacterized membrane protein
MTVSPVLILHISAGTIGLLSGAAALSIRKGSGRHQMAGKVFVLSMLTMAASASIAAFLIEEWSNVLGGITTIYFVTTAWMTLKRKAGQSGRFEIVAFLVAVAGTAGYLAFALQAANSDMGLVDGIPAGAFYVFAAVMALFAVGDLRLILRGGIVGAQRIARHLVRMCYAVFVAAGSLFLGQMQVFPEIIRETDILFVLPLVPLVLMTFWLVRVRLTKWARIAGPQPSTQ